MGTTSFYVVFFHSKNVFVVGACSICFCNLFLCHPQDELESYFVVYIYICNSVFHATESTGSTRCWNIKEGRWNQCRLTWHSIVSPPNLHFPKYHHYSIHTNTNTNTYSSLIPPLFYSHKYKYIFKYTYQGFKKIHNHMKKPLKYLSA